MNSVTLSVMDELNLFSSKMKNTITKLKLSDLNPHLMCVLCGGYYIDATTIVECLHSFCRSCIVKHLESSKYCPICEVQVHKTKPLINIRPDKTLQDIVYKLVPGLFANEMRCRKRFYKERPHYMKPNNLESVGEVSDDRKVYVSDENITFTLAYHVGSTVTNFDNRYEEISPLMQKDKRYFKCPTGVTIYHLKKLLKTKYDLNFSNYKMEIYLKNQPLHDDLTLLDISYIFLCKNQKEQKGSLDLTYKIFENVVKRQKLEENEVQNEPAQISAALQNEINDSTKDVLMKEEISENKVERTAAEEKKEKVIPTLAPALTVAQAPTSEPVLQSQIQGNQVPLLKEPEIGETNSPNSESRLIKENGVSDGEGKEVQLQISESGVMIVSEVKDGEIVRTMEDAPSKVMNNQLITGLSLDSNKKGRGGNGEIVKLETATNRPGPEPGTAATPTTIKPVSKSYKTIRCSPKTWHPVIPKEKLRPTLMKNTEEPKKPLKFFKMRNMPRFLGNPSGGVKPMFAEPEENVGGGGDARKSQEQQLHHKGTSHKVQLQQSEHSMPDKKSDSSKSRILKIDPKTLRPIEKDEMKVTQTPNVPNLLTNPFIPNNNHFLFSHLHLLPPPGPGNFTNVKTGIGKHTSFEAFKAASPNGGYPPICFPSPDHNPGFYPFSNLSKPQNFPFPVGDKMDPLLRASRLSPFSNLSGFNVAGFHASLPPSISRLLNPHQHFRKLSQSLEKKNSNKDESTKESTKTIRSNCDDNNSIKISKGTTERKVKEDKEERSEGENMRKITTATTTITTTITTTTTTTTTSTATTTMTRTRTITTATATTPTTTTIPAVAKEKEKNKNGEENAGEKREEEREVKLISNKNKQVQSLEKTSQKTAVVEVEEKNKRGVEPDKLDELQLKNGESVIDTNGIETGNHEKGGGVGEKKSSESASEKINKSESNSESDNKSIDKDK